MASAFGGRGYVGDVVGRFFPPCLGPGEVFASDRLQSVSPYNCSIFLTLDSGWGRVGFVLEGTLPSMVLEESFNPRVGMPVLTTGAHLRR